MAAKIIVLGVIGVIGFFVIRDYQKKKKSLLVEKKPKIWLLLDIIGCIFEATMEGIF